MAPPESDYLAAPTADIRCLERPAPSANGLAVVLRGTGTALVPVPNQRTGAAAPSAAPELVWATTAVDRSALRYHGRGRLLKRLIDIAATLACLPFALPLMAVTALLVRCTSSGPALFRQQRVGQFGKMFSILKFRTMYVDADERLRADPELFAQYVANDFKLRADADPRLTRIGRFLRMTSLDELPQLFNVLAGSMSLVGPRPIVRDELGNYREAAFSYLQMRPGITGRWQVDGRNLVRYPERAYLDHDYLVSWRLRTDLVILVRTVPSILRRRGCR